MNDINFKEKQTLSEISKELKIIKKELDGLEVQFMIISLSPDQDT